MEAFLKRHNLVPGRHHTAIICSDRHLVLYHMHHSRAYCPGRTKSNKHQSRTSTCVPPSGHQTAHCIAAYCCKLVVPCLGLTGAIKSATLGGLCDVSSGQRRHTSVYCMDKHQNLT